MGQYGAIADAEIKPVSNLLLADEHCRTGYQGFRNGAAEIGRGATSDGQAALRGKSTAVVGGLRRRWQQREQLLVGQRVVARTL